MLKPFYMLEGVIVLIREVEHEDGRWVEKTYEDENGDRAIIDMPIIA